MNEWTPTDKNEIKRFFGFIMGLVKLPNLHFYWSKDKACSQIFPRTVISKNRFELLLRMIHYSNNEEADENDRLYKVRSIIDTLNNIFKKHYEPDKVLCVDETLVPFCGRIIFKQYLKLKRHKYGIKIFKLCSGPGYTYNFLVYTGKSSNMEKTTPTNVVMSLCEDILEKGHILCTDN